MIFYDTLKDKVETSTCDALITVSTFLARKKNPSEHAAIIICGVVVVSAAMFAAGWAFGYRAGVLR